MDIRRLLAPITENKRKAAEDAVGQAPMPGFLSTDLEMRLTKRRRLCDPAVIPDRDPQEVNRLSLQEDVPKAAEITKDCELCLGDKFATGAYADIHKATMIRPGGTDRCQVAVKVLRYNGTTLSSKEYQNTLDRIDKRLSREMEVWKRLTHTRITPLLAYAWSSSQIIPGGGAVLVSPYRENADLRTYLSNKPSADKLLLLQQVCEGLNYIHTFEPPIAHLDLKPENILVNDCEEVELCDFGLATALEDACTGFTTSTFNAAGTVIYMPPEALKGDPRTTASDIYALGGVVLHVMSGHPPWRQIPSFKVIQEVLRGMTPSREEYTIFKYAPPVVEELWILMQRCWSFKPLDRPNASQVLDTLVDLHDRGPASEPSSTDQGGSCAPSNQGVTGSGSLNANDKALSAPGDRTEELDDLSAIVDCYQETLDLRPPGHSYRNIALHNLAQALESRYNRDKNPEDLCLAVQYYQETLDLSPLGHPDRAASLHNLANAFGSRYDQDGDPDDLNSAIQHYGAALELTSPGHPQRDATLHCLAVVLRYRYDRGKNPDDLQLTIQHNEEALNLRPPGHPNRDSSLHNLANALEVRYIRDKNPDDLHCAIRHYQEALIFCPPDHPDRPRELNGLARALKARHGLTEGCH